MLVDFPIPTLLTKIFVLGYLLSWFFVGTFYLHSSCLCRQTMVASIVAQQGTNVERSACPWTSMSLQTLPSVSFTIHCRCIYILRIVYIFSPCLIIWPPNSFSVCARRQCIKRNYYVFHSNWLEYTNTKVISTGYFFVGRWRTNFWWGVQWRLAHPVSAVKAFFTSIHDV